MSKNIAVICGEFHKKEATEMLNEVRKVAAENNLTIAEEIWVNGSYEKPLALKRVLMKENIDGAIALGIIERGETKHGLVMGHTVMQTILNLELEFMKPVGVGILGPEILPSQIPSRLLPTAQKATLAVVRMLEK
ncbi:MAG: riboflavin synthase subunit alpha [Candidatus Magasanikbacteria bacterium RIFOXYD2_FULL_39_9]|uniref:6,7-dimethyl-8-ribityllumazine synthase n=1 Tax=Candidatus Magasanikbacteria bacterium RIFOXYD1_FULL_40_23 TaxID=1798705 RepID=A0A1F6PBC1_9BACT|nr:MAG: riboflavin synthase subunit alpha [Candidatus Magasanikbacteria bacterium RIFOXYD2_FULL_39_9]OGH93350.1 MAG: riboflavin synthase subunit alpha [Candidatus Magasanikbacteria bacterium RIFOXYD1_FULL_40_23]